MPKKGRTRKKARTHVSVNENAASALISKEAELKVPRSLVIRRGSAEVEVIELISDIRRMMLPHTAIKFKEEANNRKMTISHYAKELTGPMGITHILALNQNGPNINLRLARTPSGPTLTFIIRQFSLARHIRSVQRRPYDSPSIYRYAPIVVTNNFGTDNNNNKNKKDDDAPTTPPHVKLMRITFQNLFPSINVATVKLSDCRRVILFNYIRQKRKKQHSHHPHQQQQQHHQHNENEDKKNKEDGIEKGEEEEEEVKEEEMEEEEEDVVEIRHYAIRATPISIDRKVRRIIQAKIPNLSNLEDVADYITGTTSSGLPAPPASSSSSNANNAYAASDSEPEDESSHVLLSQNYIGRGNKASSKSSLKLIEVGPRLSLKLNKVERGLGSGDIMYHAFVYKSPYEIQLRREQIQKDIILKQKRRQEQEMNVQRKKRLKEEKMEKKKSMNKKNNNNDNNTNTSDNMNTNNNIDSNNENNNSDDGK